ncbi:MAG: outer membrane protein assembly factor BamA [Candidatus Latescibacteria bacterium]|nr:outer membrane protein assembly factor BamA [bacterium]MBD3425518.1 outer membrane protein assembly factor BamA [Candidatus Latescibacterota bacterium]
MKTRTALLLAALIITQWGFFNSLGARENTVWKVESVTIQGNEAFTDEQLRSLMVTRPGGWFRSNRFRRSVFLDDLSSLKEFYRQNGYLSAVISDTTISGNSNEGSVNLTLRVEEGPVTRVEGITIFENRAFSDSTLISLIDLKRGDPFRRRALQDGMIEIATYYADNGYLNASVTPEMAINSQAHRVLIDLMIEEGEQMSISGIEIRGLEKTSEHVVLRELEFKEGQVVSHRKLAKSQKQLYLTGLFKSVRINPVKYPGDSSDRRTMLIEVEEEANSLLSVSAGYGSIEKVMGEVEFSLNNLFGTARQAGMRVQANFIERKVEGSFSEPRTFNTRLTTDLNLFYSYQDQPGFDVSRYGGLLTLGRRIGRDGQLSLRYRYEDQNLRNLETVERPEDTEPNIRSITLGFSNDTRDNLFNPSRGWFIEVRYELAGSFLQGSDAFNRAVLNTSWFKPLTRGTVLAASLETGWIDIFGASGGIPINELFYTGGPNSIRGFEYRRVGPLDTGGQPAGGQFKMIWNLEIRQAVWRWIGAAVFLDVGNVWSRVREYRFDSVRYAAGPGIRINTPIGIIRFDAGFNPDPAMGEDNIHYYLVMGNAF